MSSLTRAATHVTVEQVKEQLQEAKDALHFRRWASVDKARVAARTSQLAKALKLPISLPSRRAWSIT